jgi:uncharacterized protein with NRDE domain
VCTLTLVKKENSGFILTFNRDEVVERSNAKLNHDNITGLIYPVDEKHGGTWMAYHPYQRRFTCLLNGAFFIHERQPPYRKSRGIVVLDTFKYLTIESFIADYDLDGIEPFTMILFQEDRFIEFRWDGIEKYSKVIDQQTAIYSSCTLYDERATRLRQEWFDNLTKRTNIDKIDLWQFHQNTYKPDLSIGIHMKRQNGPITVSTAQLTFDTEEFNFKYFEHQTKKMLSANTFLKVSQQLS